MEKKDLLKFCRYYKGEDDECPRNTKYSFWAYEKKWVELTCQKDDFLGHMLDEYIAYGLSGFEKSDDTPITLKSVLFNRFSHWHGCDTEGFKDYYRDEYYG